MERKTGEAICGQRGRRIGKDGENIAIQNGRPALPVVVVVGCIGGPSIHDPAIGRPQLYQQSQIAVRRGFSLGDNELWKGLLWCSRNKRRRRRRVDRRRGDLGIDR